MNDVFTEVNEELRREKMRQLWQDWKHAILGGIATILLGATGFAVFDGWNTGRHMAETEKLFDALDRPETLMDFAADTRGGPKGYAVLSDISRRIAQINTTQLEAAETWPGIEQDLTALANDGAVPSLLRDQARLMSVHAAMQSEGWQERISELVQRLNPLLTAIDIRYPFAAQAYVTRAVLAYHGEKQAGQADIWLQRVLDAPENRVAADIRSKAADLQDYYNARQEGE